MRSLVVWLLLGRAVGGPRTLCGRSIDETFAMVPAETVYFFLGFDKTGSTSMQRLLMKYYPAESYMSGFSDCVLTSTTHIFYRWGMTGEFDIRRTIAPKQIKFFTVLRDPLERLDSAYNYFCADCQEEGRQCKMSKTNASMPIYYDYHLFCPEMTIYDYAIAFQDIYVRAFSHATETVGLSYVSTQTDFDNAVQWIRDAQPYIIFSSDFTGADPFRPLGDFLENDDIRHLRGIPRSNVHSHVFSAPPDAIASINSTFLSWDYKLTSWILSEYQQPFV